MSWLWDKSLNLKLWAHQNSSIYVEKQILKRREFSTVSLHHIFIFLYFLFSQNLNSNCRTRPVRKLLRRKFSKNWLLLNQLDDKAHFYLWNSLLHSEKSIERRKHDLSINIACLRKIVNRFPKNRKRSRWLGHTDQWEVGVDNPRCTSYVGRIQGRWKGCNLNSILCCLHSKYVHAVYRLSGAILYTGKILYTIFLFFSVNFLDLSVSLTFSNPLKWRVKYSVKKCEFYG